MAEKKRTKVTKIMGWKDCEVEQGDTIYNDIKQGTTSLSREEGKEEESNLESGEAEGRYKDPDKYILEIKRTIGPDEDVKPGFKDNVGDVEVRPTRKGARTVKLSGVSQDISIEYDSNGGAVEVIRWKTRGAVDADGNLTDISIGTVPTEAAGSEETTDPTD